MRRGHLSARVRLVAAALVLGLVSVAAAGGRDAIKSQDLKEWMTYVASDELEGRAVFTTGIGLAAAYIKEHLRTWGVKPAGGNGSYLQTVRVLGVKTTSHSTLTVETGGETRTFADGDSIIFPRNVGGKRRISADRIQFAGYGLDAPGTGHADFRGLNVKGAAVVWLGSAGPKGLDPRYRRLLAGRNRYATDQLQALASIGPEVTFGDGRGRGGQPGGPGAAPATVNAGQPTAGSPPGAAAPVATSVPGVPGQPPAAAGQPPAGRGGFGGPPIPAADFTTVQRLDAPIPPAVSGKDAFFEFLFSHAPTKYADLKRMADAQEPLPAFVLDGVKLTFNVDADYEVVRTQLAKNVVGIVEGSDPQLRSTYVAFGAHYDHIGYAEGEVTQTANGPRRAGARGRVTDGALDDRIWNGADDDGSGTVSLMALAKAFADGPRPRRSLLFVWHTGEESGLLGSRYFADYPTIPMDRIVTQLNIDMIGRNRDDKTTESNTVYPVGSDRISSELHGILEAANRSAPKPLTLDYEMNDPADLEQVYYRSDHYSYAAKGIPIIFFTTGLHPDYHANTDEVSKIEFDKMTRIVQLIYDVGARVANLDHAPARDNKGPRAGNASTSVSR
jgi:hypothetical protein